MRAESKKLKKATAILKARGLKTDEEKFSGVLFLISILVTRATLLLLLGIIAALYMWGGKALFFWLIFHLMFVWISFGFRKAAGKHFLEVVLNESESETDRMGNA